MRLSNITIRYKYQILINNILRSLNLPIRSHKLRVGGREQSGDRAGEKRSVSPGLYLENSQYAIL